jgi:TonB family protein
MRAGKAGDMTYILIGITVLLLAAYGAAIVLRRRSAALRHVVWTCAIVATLIFAPLRWRAPRRVINQPIPAVFTPTVVVSAARPGITPNVGEIAICLWVLGSAFVTLRLLVSTAQVQRVVRRAHPIETLFPIPILTSPHIPGPLVTGILRPVILLPEYASRWAPSRRRAVLAHELAHIRRRDSLILAAAHLATIVYWFHPLCWLAAARLRIESERACDDAALRIGLLPSGYAGHLLDLARAFNPQPAIPMATTSHLESRVKSILDPFVNRSFAVRRNWLAAALITAAVMAPPTVFSLHAQQTAGTGSIVGTVIDPTGAVVPNVKIVASNSDTKNKEVTASSSIGSFVFSNIPAGRYSLEVFAGGFTATRMDNLILVNGGTLRADARLIVGNISENIKVVAQGTPTPRAITAARGPIRVGGNVQVAKPTTQVQPIYPAALQAQGTEGIVLLAAIISKDGTPLSLVPQNTAVDPAFVTAATDAVSQWRYQPTLLNGEPIEVMTTITVEFKLSSKPL